MGGVLAGVAVSPLAGAMAVAVFAGFCLHRMRRWPAFGAAAALPASSRWEEAHAQYRRLEASGLAPVARRHVSLALASLDLVLGRHQAALDRVDPALAALGDSPLADRWQAVGIRAQALAQLGRLAEARREVERFVSPRTELVEMVYQRAALSVAFASDAPGSLPADDVLHDWARAALSHTRFGETLVGLAWAFHRRGDDDLARHLLAESASRMPRSSLPTAQPRLEAWAAAQRVAWGIPAGEAEDAGAID
jgi:hypothetical protein